MLATVPGAFRGFMSVNSSRRWQLPSVPSLCSCGAPCTEGWVYFPFSCVWLDWPQRSGRPIACSRNNFLGLRGPCYEKPQSFHLSPLEYSRWGKPAITWEVRLFWAPVHKGATRVMERSHVERDSWPAPSHFSHPSDPRPRITHWNREAFRCLQLQLPLTAPAPESLSKNPLSWAHTPEPCAR